MEYLKKFVDPTLLMLTFCFVVLFIVQLKIIGTLRSHTKMIMFYGRQIEEMRKMLAEGARIRRASDVSTDETGLYEVLNE